MASSFSSPSIPTISNFDSAVKIFCNPQKSYSQQLSFLAISALILLQFLWINLGYSNFSPENFSGFLDRDCFTLDTSLFSPGFSWLEDDVSPGRASFVSLSPSPALAQNAMRFAGAVAPSLAPEQKGSSFGMNLGIGGGAGGINNGSFGINYSSNKTDRKWVDNQTSIIGTNSITINTGENTNLKGALIANITNAVYPPLEGGSESAAIRGGIYYTGNNLIDGGNLVLNTNSLTFENISDHEYSHNSSVGISTSIGRGSNNTNGQGTAPASNTNQQNNFYPDGSTTISATNNGYKKEQTTKATIGDGDITTNATLTFDANGNLITTTGGTTNDETILTGLNRDITNSQTITKDTITNALNVTTTIDNRLIAAAVGSSAAQKSLSSDQRNLGKNLAVSAEATINLPIEIKNEINEAVIKVYDKLNPAENTTPEVRENLRAAIRNAAITGDIETLKEQIKALTNKTPSDNDIEAITNLSNNRDFANLREELGVISYNRFLDKYTLSTGIFFDGTGNDVNSTNPDYNEPTNVARMAELYESDSKRYIPGVGTSGGLNTACLAFGCGANSKQQEAINYLNSVINNGSNNEYLFFPIDVVSFSRGATTGADFINNINNETYWSQGLLTRSHMMFDPVGSYGLAGNGFDYGKDFSTPTNIIAIQINAKDEQRNLFDLQSLSSSDGTLAGKHWTEITLPGVHADIGGGYKEGEQGKSQDIAFYSMQTMINEAKNYGINFNPTPQNQLPSFELTTAMNLYREAQANYANNPTEENKFYRDDVNKFIQQNFTHDSTFGGSGKIYNYSIGDERGIFYPNENLLKINSSPTLKINHDFNAIIPTLDWPESDHGQDQSLNDYSNGHFVPLENQQFLGRKFSRKLIDVDQEIFVISELQNPFSPPRS